MESMKLTNFGNRCIVITFESVQKERECLTKRCPSVDDRLLSNNKNDEASWSGEELFREFVQENDMCPWNSHLEESVRGLKLVGVFYPMTLLIGGRDIYLNTVLTALGQRLLQAPLGHRIQHFGEMTDIKIKLASPLPFIPLPDALCHIITVANRDASHATFEYIMDQLFVIYNDDIQLPSEELVYQALGGLVKDRVLLHCGKGYRIVPNEMYQPAATLRHRTKTVNKQSTLRPTATVCCQTEDVNAEVPSPNKHHTSPAAGLTDAYKRRTLSPQPTTHSDEVHHRRLLRSASEKSSDKVKTGSLLSRLFGSHKKERCADKHHHASQYRTVSGQFPPVNGDAAAVGDEATEDSICSQDGSSLLVPDLTPVSHTHCAIHYPPSLQAAYLSQLSPELPSDSRYPTIKSHSSERRRRSHHRDQRVPNGDIYQHEDDLDDLYEPVRDFSQVDTSTAVDTRSHKPEHTSKHRRSRDSRSKLTNNAMTVTVPVRQSVSSKHNNDQVNNSSRRVESSVDRRPHRHHKHHHARHSHLSADGSVPHQHCETATVHQEMTGAETAWLSSSQQTVVVEGASPPVKDLPTTLDITQGQGHPDVPESDNRNKSTIDVMAVI